ncbi:hypothetical protein Hdeb2414_s0112g00798591 [Helianthus debilis subsp. tardiflorus]
MRQTFIIGYVVGITQNRINLYLIDASTVAMFHKRGGLDVTYYKENRKKLMFLFSSLICMIDSRFFFMIKFSKHVCCYRI